MSFSNGSSKKTWKRLENAGIGIPGKDTDVKDASENGAGFR